MSESQPNLGTVSPDLRDLIDYLERRLNAEIRKNQQLWQELLLYRNKVANYESDDLK